MTNNTSGSTLIFICFLFASCTRIYAGTNISDTAKLRLVPVQGRVYTVIGSLGNIAVISDSNFIIMVDTKDKAATEELQQLLLHEFPHRNIKYIVNSHMHGDHTGGNNILCKECDIIAHTNARKIKQDKNALSVNWPNITFDSSMTIYFDGEEINLIHYPNSHTNHDVLVYFAQSKVVAMGDMFFSGMFPFIGDGGSLKGLIENLGIIINWLPGDIKIIPGHGPVSGINDLIATREMLIETSDFIQKKIKAGKSLDQIKAEGLPSEWNARWGNGYCNQDCWIQTVYRSLIQDAK